MTTFGESVIIVTVYVCQGVFHVQIRQSGSVRECEDSLFSYRGKIIQIIALSNKRIEKLVRTVDANADTD